MNSISAHAGSGFGTLGAGVLCGELLVINVHWQVRWSPRAVRVPGDATGHGVPGRQHQLALRVAA